MWRVKLKEGKDRPKKPDGSWAFPSKFPGYSKTAMLVLEITKPVNHTGKVVSMDSGFWVSVRIIAVHNFCVYGQYLIKKRRYWPNNVHGDAIDSYFTNKELGSAKTFRQVFDKNPFLVHFHEDDRYVTKIMSTHGLINEIPTHKTYRGVTGEWKTFNYTEPISHHNHSNICVDDFNARRHDPMGLEDVCHTKWWPHCQFTFLCSVSKVNALNSRTRARMLPAESQLTFRRKLARGMLKNKLDSAVKWPGSPAHNWRRSNGSPIPDHELCTCPKFTRAWDLTKNKWSYVKTKYLETRCSGCICNVISYFSCNNKASLCTKCWGVHKSAQGNTY